MATKNWFENLFDTSKASDRYTGLDSSMTEDVDDREFGIDAQLNYDGSGSNTGLGLSGLSMPSMKNFGLATQAAGAIGDIYSTFWGDTAEKFDLEKKLYNQQITANNDTKANNDALKAAYAKSFGTPSGLAASSVPTTKIG